MVNDVGRNPSMSQVPIRIYNENNFFKVETELQKTSQNETYIIAYFCNYSLALNILITQIHC